MPVTFSPNTAGQMTHARRDLEREISYGHIAGQAGGALEGRLSISVLQVQRRAACAGRSRLSCRAGSWGVLGPCSSPLCRHGFLHNAPTAVMRMRVIEKDVPISYGCQDETYDYVRFDRDADAI